MFFPYFCLANPMCCNFALQIKVCKELAVGLWLSYGITLCK